MYTLVKALAKTFDSNGKWDEVSIGDVALSMVFRTYIEIIVILTSPFETAPVSFNLDHLKRLYSSSAKTLNQVLQDNGSTTLATSAVLPGITQQYARYNDAFRAGYSIKPVTGQYAPDAPSDEADRDWLFLYKQDVDPVAFGQYCLAFVNGFVHRVTANSQGIWIVDGMKSARLAKQNTVGIISFKELGALTVIPFSETQIYSQFDGLPLATKTTFKLTADLTGKTLAMVLGGYLVLMDEKTLRQVGDNLFTIDFNNYPLLERLYESKDKIDLSSLGLTPSDTNPSMLSPQEIATDDVIRRYLNLSQSFLLVIDNPNVYLEKSPLEPTRHPMRYIAHEEPIWPVINGYGRLVNFWPIEDDGLYSLNCLATWKPNYQFQTTNYMAERNVSDSKETQERSVFSRGYFLKIGCNFAMPA